MIFHGALLGTLLLASHASAAKAHALLHRSLDFEQKLRREAGLLATLTRRQDANPADSAPQISTTPQSGDAARVDLGRWETETRQKCDTAMTALNGQASNPTGLAVCYNLPFLDNSTGVFQAELRLYNISLPQDPWTGIVAGDISMALSYLGASVQMMNGSFAKRDTIEWPPVPARNEDEVLMRRQDNGGNAPQQLKVLMYVGRINANLLGDGMTEDTWQPLLLPQIELSARSPSGSDVRADLSSEEASFVNGVFAKASTPEDAAAAAASASVAAEAVGEFVLPGTKLAFFPIGLVITSAWTLAFFLTVGFGTLGRIQFRDQYRRRMQREKAMGTRTI